MRPVIAVASVLSLSLAACGQPAAPEPADAPAPSAAPAAPAHPGQALLEADGFTPANPGGGGTGRKLSFGEGEAEVIAFLARLRGGQAPTRSSNAECGAGPLTFADWGDGFQLAFADGRFAGWLANDSAPAGFSTTSGVHVGSTLAQARAGLPGLTVEQTTLGTEFAAGPIFGFLSGAGDQARVTGLWAGVSCFFR